MSDELFMRRAIELAGKARGKTSPNPMVGAVIVKDGQIIGEGFHKKAGLPHAEVEAIRSVDGSTSGATMYVSLEPCTTQGRTPPCVEAIAAADIASVIMAMEDPNPLVQGRGVIKLEKLGIKTKVGLLEREAVALNEAYIKHTKKGIPFVTLKTAISLDGRIATATGSSKWITGETSRREVKRVRSENDAILTGVGTIISDDASLEGIDESPIKRVILDGEGRIPLDAKVVKTADRIPTILMTTERIALATMGRLEDAGVEVVMIHTRETNVPVSEVLKELGRRGIQSLLVEAGTSLTSQVLEARAFDKMIAFVAPMLIGSDGMTFYDRPSPSEIGKTLRLHTTRIERFDGDTLIEMYKEEH